MTEASFGVKSTLNWLKELGKRTPLEGVTSNYVNLKRYESGFALGLKMVKGCYERLETGQNPS